MNNSYAEFGTNSRWVQLTNSLLYFSPMKFFAILLQIQPSRGKKRHGFEISDMEHTYISLDKVKFVIA